ncbi:CoA-binding protein [bacterium]|nr:CoA-binding protein [bacterium]
MLKRPINDENMIREILATDGAIAMVGMSDKPERDSHEVAQYLLHLRYKVVPINPKADEILGQKAYPSLADVPFPIEVVDVFRKSEAVPAIVDEAIKVGAKYLWLQLGVVHEEAAEKARNAGLGVVMDRCMKQERDKRV